MKIITEEYIEYVEDNNFQILMLLVKSGHPSKTSGFNNPKIVFNIALMQKFVDNQFFFSSPDVNGVKLLCGIQSG